MSARSSSARVTAADVQEVFDTVLDVGVINAFINTAHTFLDANMSGSGLSEAMLTEIEKYLACHFLALRDPRIKSESIAGEYSVTYQVGTAGDGLASTEYGRTALALDTSGKLDSLSLKRATFKVF